MGPLIREMASSVDHPAMQHKKVSDTWERGNSYERYVGRWSRQVVPIFLAWLNAAASRRWLDIGCGTGALCSAVLDYCMPMFVAGIEPSGGFLRTAKDNLADRVLLAQGTATQIPLADSSVDFVVSGLVLNFVPDPGEALVEMARVTECGGKIGAYVWDYAGKMEFLRIFWDVATELNAEAAKMDEGIRFPVCNPGALRALFDRPGLSEIELTEIDIPTPFANFDDYWQPFLGGQGPAPAYVMALDATERARLRDRLQERIPAEADGSIHLIGRAWAIRATVV